MSFKISGIADFKRRLAALPQAAKEEIRPALEAGANEITGIQKAAAPEGETGNLKESIEWEWGYTGPSEARKALGEAGLIITIKAGGALTTKEVRKGSGISYDYALGQELGTKDMDPQPYFRPGFRLGKPRAINRIARAATRGAKKAAKK